MGSNQDTNKGMDGWGKMRAKTVGRKEVKELRVQCIESINYTYRWGYSAVTNNPSVSVVTNKPAHFKCMQSCISGTLQGCSLHWVTQRVKQLSSFDSAFQPEASVITKRTFPSPAKRGEKMEMAHWSLNASAQRWYLYFHSPLHQLKPVIRPTTCTKCKVTHGVFSEHFWLPQGKYFIFENYQGGNVWERYGEPGS